MAKRRNTVTDTERGIRGFSLTARRLTHRPHPAAAAADHPAGAPEPADLSGVPVRAPNSEETIVDNNPESLARFRRYMNTTSATYNSLGRGAQLLQLSHLRLRLPESGDGRRLACRRPASPVEPPTGRIDTTTTRSRPSLIIRPVHRCVPPS